MPRRNHKARALHSQGGSTAPRYTVYDFIDDNPTPYVSQASRAMRPEAPMRRRRHIKTRR